MRTSILFIICIVFCSTMFGQEYEIGVSLGGTNYVGDIGSTSYINPNKLAGTVFFKYNYNPRVALKATYSYLPIAGDDAKAGSNFRNNRDLPFSNTINEVALGLEFNFYEFDISSEDKSWTPYILVELVAFNYDIKTATANKSKTALALPIGIGFKSKLIGNLAFSLETKFRYTFEDDLEDLEVELNGFPIEGSSNDWYMFTGVSIIYTFGRPACYTKGL
ncbi:DUF6089 family protein [Polaribacter sp.]|nr:DUF6089 family protein [Polaribacter sp.]MDB4204483.1 DUF6089 family protein [Polaribacter sp.]